MRTPGKPWRAGQPDRARQTRKRAGFYRDESSHKLRRTKRGRAAERPRRGGWGRLKKESIRLKKKDECADELWVLLLRGAEYHCAEWEHMGIAVCCQQAYWHHTETQAVIKSIYSHSVLLSSFSPSQCLLSFHTHIQHVLHYTDLTYVYEVRGIVIQIKVHFLSLKIFF